EAIAFRLAPRINAAGRLAHARIACQLLLSENPASADRLAKALCRLNNRRQQMENGLLASIQKAFKRYPEWLAKPVLVVNGDHWHEGILGIVASRLARQYHRPAVVISARDGHAKGSARSIEGIDVSASLGQCADLLERYGGHPQAAGLSLQAANIPLFRSRLEAVIAKTPVTPPPLFIDAQLPLSQVTPDLMNHLERLGPFGQGNPHPIFMALGVRVRDCRTVGIRHRQMTLEQADGHGGAIQAIQFNTPAGKGLTHFNRIAYRPQWNHWNGNRTLQLMVEDTDPQR
ncbi:single-stranded-DNA-specific exonuclease RecJ, partial [Desulfosarcina cetonica]|uniref:single-stranded-DNA-specific exonuclease RecJ n=1 Tax=Desulfosarcina cetonica TaxID=90730 RepID=UPI000B11260A